MLFPSCPEPPQALNSQRQTARFVAERNRTHHARSTPFFLHARPGKKVRRKPEIRVQGSARSARSDRTMPNNTEQPEHTISSKTQEIVIPERSETPPLTTRTSTRASAQPRLKGPEMT